MIKNTIKKHFKSILSFLLSNKKGISKLSVLTGMAKGVKLSLDLKREASYWLGNYDKWILDRVELQNIIKPGWIAWDCGAYVGFYTAIFRKLVGNNGLVYSFEASSENYDRLKDLPIINNWNNVIILNEAVGNDHTLIQFISNQGGSSGPVNLNTDLKNKDNLLIESVICRGIDELVLERGIKPPHIIKFDLETAEIFALANGDYVYNTYKPYILLELHGKDCMQAASIFLEKYNYIAKDIYFLKNVEVPWYGGNNKLDKESYVPHMLYCKPFER